MTLAKVFLESVSGNAGQSTANRSSETTNKGFDSFFDRSVSDKGNTQYEKDSNAASKASQARNNKAVKKETRKSDPAQGKQNEAENTTESPVDNSQAAQTTTAAGNVAETQQEYSGSGGVDSAELVKKISKIFDLSEDAVIALLEQLNLQPSDLADQVNLIAFAQAVYNVESPVELLSVPEAADIINYVSQAVSEYVSGVDLQPETTVETDSTLAQTAQTQNQVASELSGLVTAATTEDEGTVGMQKYAPEEPLETPETTEATMAQPQTAAKTSRSSGDGGSQQAQTGGQNSNLQAEAQTDLAMVNTAATPETAAVQFEQQVARADSARNINTQDVVNQIVESMKVEIKGNVNEVRITLKPEHLGDVTMKISTENGIVTAQFVAESQRVKEVIEANFNQLKEALQDQGFQIANLSVSVGQDDQEQRMRQFLAGRQQSAHRMSRITRAGGVETLLEEEDDYVPDTMRLLDSSVEYMA